MEHAWNSVPVSQNDSVCIPRCSGYDAERGKHTGGQYDTIRFNTTPLVFT